MKGVTRWTIGKAGCRGNRIVARASKLQPHLYDHARAILAACVAPYTMADYLNRTQAWRPLDIHPDWRTWDGAQTNKKGE